MTQDLGFAALALVMVWAGLRAVSAGDLVRALLWLALVLLATAGLYALLSAPFLAGVQVLTYVGGVITLLIFGVMVTGRHGGQRVPAQSAGRVRAALAAGALLALLSAAILGSDLEALPSGEPTSAQGLGLTLLSEHLLAFEAASLLLLAAIVGAVVLARRRDPQDAGAEARDLTGGSGADAGADGEREAAG